MQKNLGLSKGKETRRAYEEKKRKEEESLIEAGRLTVRLMTDEEKKRYGCE